ncbi:type IV pilus modification protein PilV [Lysobacter xanthus]
MLIAVLVMAIGLLGIAALQATALKSAESSMERSQAVVQTYAIIDAMRANPDAARAGAYNYTLSTACAAPGAGTLANKDITSWIDALQKSLGAGACGTVACSAAGICSVTVQWDDSRTSAQSEATADSTFKIVTGARL